MADALIEDQADESGDEAPAPEAEEVEENEYQKDGFVVDDEEADDGDDDKGDDLLNDSSSDDDDDDAPGGGRLRRNKARAAPDAEDLELIAENLGAASKPPADADDSDDDFDDAPKKRPREAAAPEPEAPAAEARLFDDDSDDEPKEKKVKSARSREDNRRLHRGRSGHPAGAPARGEDGHQPRAGPRAGGGADAPSQLQMMDMIDIFGGRKISRQGLFGRRRRGGKGRGRGLPRATSPVSWPSTTSRTPTRPSGNEICRSGSSSGATAKRTRRDYETHLEEEAAWIARKLRHPHAPADATVVAVSRLLRFYNEDCYEVPFVAACGATTVDSDIKPAELWPPGVRRGGAGAISRRSVDPQAPRPFLARR
ncbi:obsolete transcription factor [Aureococcus anophagefferens]|nr:obsolete transcription factor [Aureococcus anophagefferens]